MRNACAVYNKRAEGIAELEAEKAEAAAAAERLDNMLNHICDEYESYYSSMPADLFSNVEFYDDEDWHDLTSWYKEAEHFENTVDYKSQEEIENETWINWV